MNLAEKNVHNVAEFDGEKNVHNLDEFGGEKKCPVFMNLVVKKDAPSLY